MQGDVNAAGTTGIERSNLPFLVVGIGASAGGLAALLRLLEHMPATPGFAVVVVLHLSPTHKSNAAEVLSRATRMVVQQVVGLTPVQINHIYVIPPNKLLEMTDGHIRLSDPVGRRPSHVAIDLFFRTLAQAHRERAVGVVLSGLGADGALGLAAVKEQGGVSLVQEPTDAEYESMPRASIDARVADFVLPAADMVQQLLTLRDTAMNIRLPAADGEDVAPVQSPDTTQAAERALDDVIGLLDSRTGHDFRNYKRGTLLRRIERRMQVNGMVALPQYRDFLKFDEREPAELLQDMLIAVTSFYRDRASFEAFERDAAVVLMQQDPAPAEVRAWVVGCSTGEEAYSVAMILSELNLHHTRLQVFATDIDTRALTLAREASYPKTIVLDVPPARLRQHFRIHNDRYQVSKPVRDKVLFAEHNVLRDPPFSRLDLITCRNLLIYLDRDSQARVLKTFAGVLKPGGFLMLGTAESVDALPGAFEPVDKKNRLFRALGRPAGRAGAVTRSASPMPARRATPTTGTDAVPSGIAIQARESTDVQYRRLVQACGKPCVIIKRTGEIVFLSEGTDRFLQLRSGVPSTNLIDAVRPELRLDIRTALFQATTQGAEAERRHIQIEREGQSSILTVTIQALLDGDADTGLYLAVFEETRVDPVGAQVRSPASHDPVMAQLEAELLATKQQLHDSVRQHDIATQDLKISNEELQAINEELRSATEELESSKDELQSTNEELSTVNFELRSQVDATDQSNDDLRNLIASTNIATLFVDRDMRIKRFTPRAVGLFNLIDSDLDRPLTDITHQLHFDQLDRFARDAFTELKVTEVEVPSQDGRWFLARSQPYRTSEDVIDGAVLTFVDITTRRQVEADLRESEARMRLLFKNTTDYVVITFDRDGIMETWNAGAEAVFGYTEAEAVGQPGALIFTPEDRAGNVDQVEMDQARAAGRSLDERWHLHKNGSRMFMSGVMCALGEGAALGFAKIARDITQRKIQEEQQRKLLERETEVRQEVEQMNRLRDEFLAVMSHELKNPLNLININAHLISRQPDVAGTNIARYAETIRKSVTAQARIIDDLLDLSRLRTGKLLLEWSIVDLAAIATAACNSAASMATTKRVAFTRDLPGEPLLIKGDEVRVEQMIWNLLSNAFKFVDQGGNIHVRLERGNDTTARLTVSDTGQGIEANKISRLFEMFWQGDSRDTRRHGGLGIGLSLVKQLSDLHGGTVEASSEGVGKGATFVLKLPLSSASETLTTHEADSASGSLAGLKVLLIDDSSDTLEGFGDMLQAEGAEVHSYDSPMRALDAATHNSFDVMISDIGMPDINGFELLARMRQLPQHRDIPAIALSGFGFVRQTEASKQSSYQTHLDKPVSPTDLIQAILTVTGRLPSDDASG